MATQDSVNKLGTPQEVTISLLPAGGAKLY